MHWISALVCAPSSARSELLLLLCAAAAVAADGGAAAPGAGGAVRCGAVLNAVQSRPVCERCKTSLGEGKALAKSAKVEAAATAAAAQADV